MTATHTLKLDAWHDPKTEAPLGYTISSPYYDDEAARDAVMALFPKAAGLKPSTCSHPTDGESYLNGSTTSPTIHTYVSLRPTKGNERNETGIARFQKFIAAAAKAGVEIDYRPQFSSSYPTLDAAVAAIA